MTKEEEMALRELAAKPHYISKVSDVLGPLSLWSKSGLEAEIRKAVEAEREACAQIADRLADQDLEHNFSALIAHNIRARTKHE